MMEDPTPADRDARTRERLAQTSPEGAPPPPAWRRASWLLLLGVLAAIAVAAGLAGWAIAGQTGALVGVALAVLAGAVRAAPVLIAATLRRGERTRAQR